MTELRETADKFDIPPPGDRYDFVEALVKNCYITLCTGLCIHAFATSRDKQDLRERLVGHLQLLEAKPLPGCSRSDLPKVLKDRIEKAMRYAVAVT